MKEPLVSIIIPTYNRAHLIGETLDSVLAQTYQNWECIVIDDGSTDDTAEVMATYCGKDSRFQYHQRPADRLSGGNAARNYGFELSRGEFVNWFDSDDLMTENHLKEKVEAIIFYNVDFIVADCVNFKTDKDIHLGKPFNTVRQNKHLNAMNFAFHTIGWITDDFFGKRILLDSIRFNEKLRAGQEYNFFLRLLFKNSNGHFLNKVLTKARLHDQSLSSKSYDRLGNRHKINAEIKLLTLEDIYISAPKPLRAWFISGYMQFAFETALQKQNQSYLTKGFWLVSRTNSVFKGIIFLFGIFTARFFSKGYNIIKYVRLK
ncbi:glycosyltransferase family 2 protein [Aequorivita flava]|uniref:Glycosyltransferase n=1 Tax=Aequorivita flava TaxID=3114371 RepID=A0AB35YQM5_9FLAO